VSGDVDFRLLFESSPDILLVLAPDAPRFTMVGATRARHAVTHTTPEQIEGRGLFEVFPDAPDDSDATGTRNLRASLDRVLATRAPDTMAVQRYDIAGPDGAFTARYWSPKNIPVLDGGGNVRYILHRVEDVTELVRASEANHALLDPGRSLEREVVARSRELASANEALREVAEKLTALDRAKTEFFSNVSHEFRTPLTLMLGPLEDALAEAAPALGARQRDRIRTAHDNALRLLKLVNTLLEFSRLQADRAQPRFAPTDVGQATADLAAMFESAISKTQVRLVIDGPRLREPVWVDREMWEKIVLNLISNAFKFTHAGEIAVRVIEGPDAVTLEVADTGIGIPESELPRLFERFHRVAGASGRTYEGSGIGLALVQELVGLHGGAIEVDSAVGAGTTFRIRIPKGHAHLPADAITQDAPPVAGREAAAHLVDVQRWLRAPAIAEEATPPGTDAPRPRVLVVDDNADLREYIAALLAPAYEVSTAVDGLDGLAGARVSLPDLIVSDVMMPGLTGLELVRQLRSDPQTASIPIILLSARAGQDSAIEGLDAGSDDYLVKPFAAPELLARVRTHIEIAKRRREWIEELEHANRELDAFTYSVAHDLRAPLRAVNGFAEILLESKFAQLDDDGQRCLRLLAESGGRMAELIEDLLALSRISRSELTREPLDLSRLATEIAAQLATRHPERTVEFAIEPGVHGDGDARLLRIVLENLLGNSWKFTARREAARIELGVTAWQGTPVYFVRDNGAGFDMAYAGKLFGVFQRLHSQSEFEGTGVGLATVQRIITRHRGRIWADGAVDAGATFCFTLAPLPGNGRPAPAGVAAGSDAGAAPP